MMPSVARAPTPTTSSWRTDLWLPVRFTVDDVKAVPVGCTAMQRYRGAAGGLGSLREIVQDGLRGGQD
uniref:Uncharacterized protein n=1 Tax=Streptomyces sp. NBC_00093 TaxID=2975649 RepID=A0AAU2AGF3_9ACTN